MSITCLPLDCVDGDTDVFGSVVSNVNHETAVSLLCWSELFTLPPLSTFLLSDMTKFSLLVDHTGMSIHQTSNHIFALCACIVNTENAYMSSVCLHCVTVYACLLEWTLIDDMYM